MTRPERTAAHPLEEPEEPVTGSARESDESGEESLPSFSEQLAEQLGGWRGLIESSIPVTVFVIVNVVTSLRPAIIVSVASGLLIAVYRLSRRQLLKVGYEWLHDNGTLDTRNNIFGMQYVTSIDSLYKAFR